MFPSDHHRHGRHNSQVSEPSAEPNKTLSKYHPLTNCGNTINLITFTNIGIWVFGVWADGIFNKYTEKHGRMMLVKNFYERHKSRSDESEA
jgi:hypothetical protein